MDRILRWSVVALAVLDAGYMVIDGIRALIAGDYLTPRSGPYAGQLGPWAKVVEAIGIAPRSALMKSIFVVYGAAWLAVVVAFAMEARWAGWAMATLAAGSLWYLWVGTVMSVVVLGLLGVLALRSAAGP